MKKIFVIALAAMSTMFVSCSKNVDDQAKDYVQQMVEIMKSGDEEKGKALEAEMEKWIEGLSDEDKARVDSVMESEFQKVLPELLGAMGAAFGDAADGVEESVEGAVEDIADDAAQEIKDAAEDAANKIKDAAEDAAADVIDQAKDAAADALKNL